MELAAVFTATVAAISTFLASGVEEVSKQVVLDTYEVLKKAVKSKFGQDSQSAKAIQALEEEPGNEGKQLLLAGNIKIEKVDKDAEIPEITQQLIKTL